MRVSPPFKRMAPITLLVSLTLISVQTTASATQDRQHNRGQTVSQQTSLDDEITEAEDELRETQIELATLYENVTAAQQRHNQAAEEADTARAEADRAREEAEEAAREERELRRQVDELAAASYRQGSTVGSPLAYFGSDGPSDMLSRSSLLNMISDEHLDVVSTAQRAAEEKNETKESAQQSAEEAIQAESHAAEAKAEAERAYRDAVEEESEAQDKADELIAQKEMLEEHPGAAATNSDGVVEPTTGELTSPYGARWGTVHYGIDIANDTGTSIHSVLGGTVISSGPASGFGLWVRVEHDNGLVTVYGHIEESLVSVGQRVDAGEEIAKMGERGQATGPHLHFEVHDGGQKIDPLVWLRSHGISY